MIDWLRYVAIGLALALALAAYVEFRRGRPPGRLALGLLVAGLVLVVGQTVVASVQLAGGHHLSEPATFIGYLGTTVIMLPAAGYVARLERSRWSSLAIVVAALVVAVLEVRLQQIWTR
ncbi:hypothetical protein [Cumulibacter manganitolerans]|uniref:hypothetical protein n=1 Tax=Cumulibacter manganitolerans TaxID=1884992 RepID=UPI001296CC92|nr:hypothetical protein [Cumulibacter manganitolerans]